MTWRINGMEVLVMRVMPEGVGDCLGFPGNALD